MGEDLNNAYRRYADLIRSHAYRIIHDRDAAEDILQEVLVRAWRKGDQWKGSGSYAGWLTKMTVNLSLNYIRSRHRRKEQTLRASDTEDDDASGFFDRTAAERSSDPEVQLIRSTEKALVRRLISELPLDKREVLTLFHQEDYSIDEVAAYLGIPEGTVKSRLYYGRKTLSERLRSIMGDE